MAYYGSMTLTTFDFATAQIDCFAESKLAYFDNIAAVVAFPSDLHFAEGNFVAAYYGALDKAEKMVDKFWEALADAWGLKNKLDFQLETGPYCFVAA